MQRVMKAMGALGSLALLASCATPALWQATDPDECVRVPQAIANTNDLAARGIPYLRSESTGDIYIPKTQARKLRDYTVRALAAPVTVTLDAVGGVTVVCVGWVALAVGAEWGQRVQDNPADPKPVVIYPHPHDAP